MDIEKEINEAFNLNPTNEEVIENTIRIIIEVLEIYNLYILSARCDHQKCTLYNIQDGLIYDYIRSTYPPHIQLSTEVYVCIHGIPHICNDIECSKTIYTGSKKYCGITKRSQTILSGSTTTSTNVKGTTITTTVDVGTRNAMESVSYRKNITIDNIFRRRRFEIERLGPGSDLNGSSGEPAKGESLQRIFKSLSKAKNRNRNKKNNIRRLGFSRAKMLLLIKTFLLKQPIYSFNGIDIFLSSQVLHLNFTRYWRCMLKVVDGSNAIDHIREALKLIMSFEKIDVAGIFKRFVAEGNCNAKGEKRQIIVINKKENPEETNTGIYMKLVDQMDLIINKVLPGISRFVYKLERIIELHKAFLMKYVKRMIEKKPVLHTNHSNKVIYRKYGKRARFFEYLSIFDFDYSWFESKFSDFPGLALRCKYIKRSLKLYFLRELCSEYSNNKKIDPSEHCIAFLDLCRVGFDIKVMGYTKTIIKKDIYIAKYLEELNKLTSFGFNKPSHNKGLKGITTDISILVRVYGPMVIYKFINED